MNMNMNILTLAGLIRIRRVKCDQSRPSCNKCQSTGRTCDGYEQEVPNLAIISNSGTEMQRWQLPLPQPASLLQPLMVLASSAPSEHAAMSFFERICVRDLNEFHPSPAWRQTLMFFSQTVPAVRHAAVALALMHRRNRDARSNNAQLQQAGSGHLFHYSRAIQLLLQHQQAAAGPATEETRAITLLVCYLFVCVETLAGSPEALTHLRAGVELIKGSTEQILDDSSAASSPSSCASSLAGVGELTYQIKRQIRRLDMQTAIYVLDWAPTDVDEVLGFQLPLRGSAFASMDDAVDTLEALIARAMQLRNTAQEQGLLSGSSQGQPLLSVLPLKDIILDQLETWSACFESLQQQQQSQSQSSNDDGQKPVLLLRLQYTAAWIYLSGLGPAREMEYDKFLAHFQHAVSLATDLQTMRERCSGGSSSEPAFTPEIGTVVVLFIIATKCRHPIVRRQALDLLRRRETQEASWDSVVTARVVERVIEIEESACKAEKPEVMVMSMDQIETHQRIETLWLSNSRSKVEISYVLCGQSQVHTESLSLST